MGKLRVTTTTSSWVVGCDALALIETRVALLSVAGPETAVKAVNACLQSNVNSRFEFDQDIRVGRKPGSEGWERYCPTMERDKAGYETHKTRLGFNTWHLLAVSKLPGLLPVLSESALNRELRSPLFTTPFLREWVPYLSVKLAEAGMLQILPGFNTTCAFLKAGTPELDEAVTVGVSEGHLKIGRVA